MEVRELDQLGRGVAEPLADRVAAADRREEREEVGDAELERLTAPERLAVGEALCVRDSRALRLPEAVVVPDLERVGLPVVVRVDVGDRVPFEEAVALLLIVAVFVLVPDAEEDFEAVLDLVEVALVVLVLDCTAVRVAVGLGRVVKLGRALRVAVRVALAEAVGSAPKMPNSRGINPSLNVSTLSAISS